MNRINYNRLFLKNTRPIMSSGSPVSQLEIQLKLSILVVKTDEIQISRSPWPYGWGVRTQSGRPREGLGPKAGWWRDAQRACQTTWLHRTTFMYPVMIEWGGPVSQLEIHWNLSIFEREFEDDPGSISPRVHAHRHITGRCDAR